MAKHFTILMLFWGKKLAVIFWGLQAWLEAHTEAKAELGEVNHLLPTALGWALTVVLVTMKHKFSLCVRAALGSTIQPILEKST